MISSNKNNTSKPKHQQLCAVNCDARNTNKTRKAKLIKKQKENQQPHFSKRKTHTSVLEINTIQLQRTNWDKYHINNNNKNEKEEKKVTHFVSRLFGNSARCLWYMVTSYFDGSFCPSWNPIHQNMKLSIFLKKIFLYPQVYFLGFRLPPAMRTSTFSWRISYRSSSLAPTKGPHKIGPIRE